MGSTGAVEVQRKNSSWWPGKIVRPKELSASHLTSPPSGTLVKLLGRKDASVHPRKTFANSLTFESAGPLFDLPDFPPLSLLRGESSSMPPPRAAVRTEFETFCPPLPPECIFVFIPRALSCVDFKIFCPLLVLFVGMI
ncbi:hypothetical protein TorRG33x02_123750 [Trema orientale]|uniref:PWWP domain containing protein n=1 Tax=Trema orientale TaxID=63057 RepID=A0A2P5F1V5_TREOI|nr:hypothetical protein TorRG33x02_123750 [Trema orientale]